MRLFDFFDYRVQESGQTIFAIQGTRSITYQQANEQINRIANGLINKGLQKGDRIALLAKNCLEYALFYYAAAKAGVVPVPLNFRLAAPEWSYIINDAEAKLIIASNHYLTGIDSVRNDLPTVTSFIVLGDEQEGWQAYDQWLASEITSPPNRTIEETDEVYQMYTSGTTGHPKGAVLIHKAVTANILQFSAVINYQIGERFLIVTPLYHAAAAISTFICIHFGGTLFILEDFHPLEVVKALSEHRIFNAALVPAMIQACLVHVPNIATYDFSSLKYLCYGASPISEQTLRQALTVFKCSFVQIYGMTETTVAITGLLAEHHLTALAQKPQLLLSAGRPLPATEIRIVDEEDNPLPQGSTGEIIARGPQLMQGYWHKPEATAEALRGGWMHTGDAGYLDEQGFLYIQDRVKDMIVSGGENVYPRVIEDVLFQHSAIADTAVIGVPDKQWGETVKAIVVLRAGATATAEEILAFCRTKLGGFECPTSVDFMEMLPRNPSGKVLKRQLREPYWQGYTRRIS